MPFGSKMRIVSEGFSVILGFNGCTWEFLVSKLLLNAHCISKVILACGDSHTLEGGSSRIKATQKGTPWGFASAKDKDLWSRKPLDSTYTNGLWIEQPGVCEEACWGFLRNRGFALLSLDGRHSVNAILGRSWEEGQAGVTADLP